MHYITLYIRKWSVVRQSWYYLFIYIVSDVTFFLEVVHCSSKRTQDVRVRRSIPSSLRETKSTPPRYILSIVCVLYYYIYLENSISGADGYPYRVRKFMYRLLYRRLSTLPILYTDTLAHSMINVQYWCKMGSHPSIHSIPGSLCNPLRIVLIHTSGVPCFKIA